MPGSRCVVQGCGNTSNLRAGISLHNSPLSGNTKALWKRFITTHRANFEPQGRYVVCSEHFTEDCFSRTVHDGRSMKRLVKEAVPTIWRANEKAPGSSVRDRRMVSISRVNYIATRTFVFASQIHLLICYYCN